MPIFTVIFTKKPTRAEEEMGVGETVVHGPTTVAAATPEAAVAQVGGAAGKAGVDLSSSLIHVEVRPFL